jgi:peroxiredoxin
MNRSVGLSVDTSDSPKPGSRRLLAAITVTLVVSVTLNVLQAHKIQKGYTVESAKMADRLLKVGTSVPPIEANRLDGQVEVISYGGVNQPTVLYVFTPPCPWCARNIDNFKALVEKDSAQYRIIGVSLSQEGLAEYVAKNDLKLPIYSGLSEETKRAYKLSGTPQTIVVSRDGKVLQNWMGAYSGAQKAQVEAFFHVALPGLSASPPPLSGTKGAGS